MAQRTDQIACAYEDGNDANAWRVDPVFKLGLDRRPLDEAADLASAPTFSRMENAGPLQALYRMAQAFVDQFIDSYARPPAVVVLEMDHSEDMGHGRQEQLFYNAHDRSHCYLPLFLFEGVSGQLAAAAPRPGRSPTGAENAALLQRVLKRLRAAWPDPHVVLRGGSRFATNEMLRLAKETPRTDFIFGLSGNAVFAPLAAPFLEGVRRLHETRCALARANRRAVPAATRSYHALNYRAKSWPEAFRIVLKAEAMALGGNPRFVVTPPRPTQSGEPLPGPLLRPRPG